MGDFVLFAVVGFLAQLVDGALGMAYGVVSTTVLLTFGVSPATASASVHAAELFTTAASGSFHAVQRNINWQLFWRLMPAGVAGGVTGAYVLTSFDGNQLRPFVTAYLGVMGLYILYRAFRGRPKIRHQQTGLIVGLGATGGFVDAAGGGGWGPVVSSGLIGNGGEARTTIGTVNLVEFFLTAAITASFLIALLSGHWQEAGALTDHFAAIAGLVAGGLLAAPLAATIVRIVPHQPLMVMVGVLISLLAAYQTFMLVGA